MTIGLLFSDDTAPLSWSEAQGIKLEFGTKGAMLATVPRLWTPPFVLISSFIVTNKERDAKSIADLKSEIVARIREIALPENDLLVRSSIVGECIWERGTYLSERISSNEDNFLDRLRQAVIRILKSAPERKVGIVIQQYRKPKSRGDFGNLLRISKTRDHWELSVVTHQGTSRVRLNSQRDQAAAPLDVLRFRGIRSAERLFGMIAAWLNSELLRGRSSRLNCEWIRDDELFYIVQIDEEDEDYIGINPFQMRIAVCHTALQASGLLLKPADQSAIRYWDKLKVLEDLWETNATFKPKLFYIPADLLQLDNEADLKKVLREEFRSLIGPDGIVVRTSVRAGTAKIPNLPRTECIDPDNAAIWCFARIREMDLENIDIANIAFIAHRFLASRSSAWVRADPANPIVEVHSIWGLPDALQYCPYDTWEVHVPTATATEYSDYKSDILVPCEDGGWEHRRVKNELARNLSIGRRDAIDISIRTASIAERLGRACHVMWFVGCQDADGVNFSLPWYWTEAHPAEKNRDRSNYRIVNIRNKADLESFRTLEGSRVKQAIELKPVNLDLMRDTNFIIAVGTTAKEADVPVILLGSTLAHAYYQLRSVGCVVVTRGEKEHSRIRRNTVFGKLVRDKIPLRIAARREHEVTRKIPNTLIKGFLTSKLIEEALEVRAAPNAEQKKVELADLFEVVRALIDIEGLSVAEVIEVANEKKAKLGGFAEGLLLLKTGIKKEARARRFDGEKPGTPVLGRKTSENTCEIPFSFFGFMEFDQTRSIYFEHLGVRLDMILHGDRIEIQLGKGEEQLHLPLEVDIEQEL